MRLQLIRFLASITVALVFIGDATAQEVEAGHGSAASNLSMYRDDDRTLVVTSMVDGDVAVADDIVLGGHFLVDVVSTASVDVMSAATPRFDEQRVESALRATFRGPKELDLNVGVVRSVEADWKSHSVQVGVAREFAQKNTRIALGYAHVGNSVGRSKDLTFSEQLTINSIQFGITQLIDPKTIASLTYSHQGSNGWHSSPYRYVQTTAGYSVLEAHPHSRSRHALTLQARRYVGKATAMDLSYRFYRDDWGVLSHTAATSLRYSPGTKWDMRLFSRVYAQGAAHFWRKRYDMLMTYVSGDRELSTFWNFSLGTKITRRVGELTISGKVDVIRYWFLEFNPLASRVALVSSLGVHYQW